MTTTLPFALDDAQWNQLVAQVGRSFDDLTLKRGFQYFKQDRVHAVTMSDTSIVDASVDGSNLYDVSVDLLHVDKSDCSCPVAARCKHIIAVLLYYASDQGRPVPAIVNARAAVAAVSGKPGAAANAAAKGKALPVRPAAFEPEEFASLSVPEWHERFAATLGPFGHSPRFLQEAKDMLTGIYSLKPALPLVGEMLFKLHASLFALEKMVKPAQEDWRHSGLFMGYHTQLAMDELLSEAMNGLAELLPITSESGYWPRLTETLAYLRTHMLREDRSLNCFTKLYQAVWMQWIRPNLDGNPALVHAELQELRTAADALGQHLSYLPWTLAQCLMLFELNRDEDAFALLRDAADKKTLQPAQAAPLFEALVHAEAWHRLVSWLEHVGPLLGGFRGDDLSSYGVYWQTALAHAEEAEPRMWKTLAAMLPYSRSLYEENLMAYGRWQQWMDYQLSRGQEPLEFRVGVLKPIEKEAPELLLPFYHQAVERYVLLKNRDSYKMAVKLLKRLNKLYVKLKKPERWEQFFDAFAAKHSRLRALQEELRKGGLLA
ncbi:SWIM zinc finger family protein [Paenibacillus silvisoli]|uniref:SWIM zinc finger family protein n=1 Tax=Paenibacillus silvisoli TaxID=3110539 RepID=UPI002803B2B9|nr:SWIM zinc finger family protein [Paenibacillus silvisoli]